MSSTDDLHGEHAEVLRMVRILEALRPLIAKGEALPLEDWTDILGFLRVFVDRCHHGKEEEVLFPAMLPVADQETRALIQQLLDEHEQGRRLVASLASATGVEHVAAAGSPEEREFDTDGAAEAIDRYVALLRPHVVNEERHLFPAADEILAPEVQMKVQEDFDRIEEEVIGPGQHEALELTVERLTDLYLSAEGHTHGFYD
jgi:hemerythrin-like domain-containing protein